MTIAAIKTVEAREVQPHTDWLLTDENTFRRVLRRTVWSTSPEQFAFFFEPDVYDGNEVSETRYTNEGVRVLRMAWRSA